MTFGVRLKYERERIGLNQTDFAALASTTKKSQISYEKDAVLPKADYLLAIHNAGVDVIYVLTGERSPLQIDKAKILGNLEAIQAHLSDTTVQINKLP